VYTLRELIEAKMNGLSIKPQEVTEPPPVIDLMAALKRSLAQEAPAKGTGADKRKGAKAAPDRAPAAIASTGVRWPKGEGGARGPHKRRKKA
jgi:hypothetical protein